MSAIDQYMPIHDVASRHTTWVAAPPDVVLAVVRSADFGKLWLVRGLMGLRLLPAAVLHPVEGWRRLHRPSELRTRSLAGASFTVLADWPDEIVYGLQGRFWTPTGGLVPVTPATFAMGPPAGLAQAAWTFRTTPERQGTRLVTETRVRTGDRHTARLFRRYWRAIRPFSGLMRRNMLSLVRRRAEAEARRAGTA